MLPLSHTYALEVSHIMLWRGDSIILHPKFDMMKMLQSVAKYKIERLYLVSLEDFIHFESGTDSIIVSRFHPL